MKTTSKTAFAAAFALIFSILSAVPASAGVKYDRICAYDTDTWSLNLPAGELTQIIIRGDGDTDLDFWLVDENGNVIDSDTDGTDYCVLEVRPRWDGKFKVIIKNHGSVYNDYRLEVR